MMFHWLSISSIKPPKSVSLVALPKGSLGEYSSSSVNTETPCLGGLSPALKGQKNMLTVRPPCFKMSLPLRQSHRWASSVCDRVKYWDTSSGKGHLLGRVFRVRQCGRKSRDWTVRLFRGETLWTDLTCLWGALGCRLLYCPRLTQRLRPLPLQSFRPHYLLS